MSLDSVNDRTWKTYRIWVVLGHFEVFATTFLILQVEDPLLSQVLSSYLPNEKNLKCSYCAIKNSSSQFTDRSPPPFTRVRWGGPWWMAALDIESAVHFPCLITCYYLIMYKFQGGEEEGEPPPLFIWCRPSIALPLKESASLPRLTIN